MHPLVKNHFSKYLKILKKILSVHLDILCSLTKLCKKKIIFVTYVKKTIFLCYKIAIYVAVFCLFYTGNKKCLFTPKLWWMDIECSDAYQEFFVQIIWIFNIYLKYISIIGAFTPMSQKKKPYPHPYELSWWEAAIHTKSFLRWVDQSNPWGAWKYITEWWTFLGFSVHSHMHGNQRSKIKQYNYT
jgi:hypothetical protein